jgi:hypothetical protein
MVLPSNCLPVAFSGPDSVFCNSIQPAAAQGKQTASRRQADDNGRELTGFD